MNSQTTPLRPWRSQRLCESVFLQSPKSAELAELLSVKMTYRTTAWRSLRLRERYFPADFLDRIFMIQESFCSESFY